ncbi:MAG: hypothetical protein GC168_14445 [Candidatus Hydrogenedens sp.]|nr:hypothetical protein [Candidatus Hydrogenedens sp.]
MPNQPKSVARRSRIVRLRLLALLILAGVFAAGMLFVSYQLEDVRGRVAEMLSERAGGRLELGALEIAGLRGVRVQDFEASLAPSGGPGIHIACPEILFQVDLMGLLYGAATIDLIRVDGAVITIDPPEAGAWTSGEASPPEMNAPTQSAGGGVDALFSAIDKALPTFPFRIRGEDCELHIHDITPGNDVAVTAMQLDAYRLADASDVTVSLDALMNGREDKPLHAHVRYGSAEDFDVRLSHGLISADDINVYLPAEQQFVPSGSISPTLRVSGFPGKSIFVAVDASYHGLTIRNQPEFLPPLDGRLMALAEYDARAQALEINRASVDSQAFSGALEGKVLLSGAEPEFDLVLRAARLPVRDVLNDVLAKQQADWGLGDVQLQEPFDVSVALRGTSSAPEFVVSAAIDGGHLELAPAQVAGLTASVDFGRIEAHWKGEGMPTGSLQITGGQVVHKPAGIRLDAITASARIEGNVIVLEPFSANFTGSPMVGSARYEMTTGKTDFALSGTFANIDDTPASRGLKDFYLAGSAGFRVSGSMSDGSISADVSVDATQTQIEFEWWLKKAKGIGAVLHGVHIDFTPKKRLQITGGVTLDATELSAAVDFSWRGGKLELDKIRAKTPRLDTGTADRCLFVPYRMSGGGASDATFEWDAIPEFDPGNKFTITGNLDNAIVLARGVETPIQVKNARIVVSTETAAESTGYVEIDAEQASVPSLSEKWLLPLEPEDLVHEEPVKPRAWTYKFRAAQIEFPPWKGTAFEGDATDTEGAFHMHRFAAEVDGGSLSGDYLLEKKDNIGHLKAQWDQVPAVYLLRHLELPEVVVGNATGHVDYAMDQDDPATLKGTGSFQIDNGKFSADFLISQLSETLQSDSTALPPSLNFSVLRSDLIFTGDRVDTPGLYLESEGLKVHGEGGFVTNGDIDYDIKVALSPSTADKIDILHNYFNIEGHKISQAELELGFHVSGPMFRPTSSVEGLPPVGVTLVSGAFEMTGEALKVIDLPRKLLVDMFKIGGGIAGARRQQAE